MFFLYCSPFCHRVDETSLEAFALRLYRERNKVCMLLFDVML